jgi:hypothetical protein
VPTSTLPSLTIGFRRAEMTAFWTLTTAALSVALGLVAMAFGARAPWVWGAAGLWILLPGLVWPKWFEIGIRGWNKGVRVFVGALRVYVLKVCYYLLFGAMSCTGSSLDLVLTSDVSGWIPRLQHDPISSESGSLAASDVWWGHGLLAFARNPTKLWMLCLFPTLMLLRLLRDEGQESALPSNTYTLY